ncbi:MAG: YqeG family HAD IIIA-type phosphatase [Actinomycetota bacterium]|nr:YqeG family HAD IIIA-type phosphatase [Actinomycetota bacterium]
MFKKGFLANFKPDYFADSIYDIDGEWLAAKNINAMIIDVDNTIMARGERLPDDKLRLWVSGLRDSGIKLLVISNNWTDRVKRIAGHLELPLLAPAAKPLGPAYKIAIGRLGVAAAEIAIIGDQLFTDVLGGNRVGIRTILVAPISEVDLIHTKALRVFERILLKRLSGQLLVEGRWKNI